MKNGTPRYEYDLSHLSYSAGTLGHVIPLSVIPVLPNDTLEISLDGALRLAPLRHFLVSDAHVHLSAYYVRHRHVYGQDEWENFISKGEQYNSAGASQLDTVTLGTSNVINLIPGCPVKGTVPAWIIRGLTSIWDHYWRIPNYEDSKDPDYLQTIGNVDLWLQNGPIAARLPEMWNTGLEDTRYDATTFADVASTTSFSLLDLSQIIGTYDTEVDRDWFEKRYRDLIKGSWGSNGVSADADQRPELLNVVEGYISGEDVNSTDYANTGRYKGKSTSAVGMKIPPKYFNEHGAVWIVACVRFPSVIKGHVHYLANRTLEYDDFAGDPEIVRTRPPIELTKDDFIDQATTGTNSWGWHPYAQWYRTHPNHVTSQLTQATIKGYPFIDELDISSNDKRYYDHAGYQADYFESTSEIGNAHWTICANVEVNAKRVIPPANSSIYAGANI